MSVHGIVEQYPGESYPSQPRHNAESSAEDTEFRALFTKGYFKSMLNANSTFSQNLFGHIAKKIIYAKNAMLQIGYRDAKQLACALLFLFIFTSFNIKRIKRKTFIE